MDQISLWFVCKSCRFSFSGVTNFIKHKTDSHFSEFKSVTCIVFEESFSNVKGDINTKPEGFVEDPVDEDCCSGKSQSPKPLNNNKSTFTNFDCQILEGSEHFTNHELDHADSRAVSFTIENDSVTINVGPLNDADYAHNPNQIALKQVDAPENEIFDQAFMESAKVTVQEILNPSNSEKQSLFSPDIQENLDSELTVFSPKSVDLALDSSQDVEINSVIFSFDVCTDAATVVNGVDPGPDSVPFQRESEQAGNMCEIETPLATVELFATDESKDISFSQSYVTCVKIVDNKHGFLENPFVLLRRLTAKELQGALSILQEPIKKQSKSMDGVGSDIDYVSINSDAKTGTISDNEIGDTYYPSRRKLNSKKKQVEGKPPKTCCLNTAPKMAAKKKLPLSSHCDLCNKSFKLHCDLMLHNFVNHLSMEEKIAGARFKCDQCPKVFLRKSAFVYHTEIHKSKTEQIRPFVCEICDYSCTLKSGLKKHLISHSDFRPFKCQFPSCDKAFKRKKHLVNHEKVFHSNSRPFKCSHPNCTKTFKQSSNLKSHILAVHGAKIRHRSQIFLCTEENCNKTYGTRIGLKYHLITVHSIGSESDLQTFLCELCGKEFKIKQQLKVHTLKVHTQERPFKCTVEGCSAAFKLESRLVTHRRSHGGAQIYLCTMCGKSYSLYNSFCKHQRSHKKEISSLEATV